MNDFVLYVDVIVPYPLSNTYTYHVPKEMAERIVEGQRVVVPFRNKLIVAITLKLHHNKPEDYNTKAVVSVIDKIPSVDTIQLNFWAWIANYYQCSLGEVMKAAIPSSLRLDADAKITIETPLEEEDLMGLELDAQELYLYLLVHRDTKLTELVKAFKHLDVYQIVSELVKSHILSCDGSVRGKLHRMIKKVCLAPSYREIEVLDFLLKGLKRAPKQLDLLEYMVDECRILDQWDFSFSYDSLKRKGFDSTIRALKEKGILKVFEEEEVPMVVNETSSEDLLPALSTIQQKAYKDILNLFYSTPVVLLHGVTASGKTEIYIRLIADCLKTGKQVLYLLPEIGLTTQIIRRLQNVFGKKVSIYHSRLSDGERLDVWNKMRQLDLNDKDAECQVVLGARSAVFLPFKKLGLIIVDEEHESSFKQYDPSPRYNARDAAIVLAHSHQCKTLLGSATPSIESYYNAQSGKYGLVELFHRFNNIVPPSIQIADIKEARRTKTMRGSLTPILYDEIKGSLENNKQVILFQNRRGYGLFVQCVTCGWTPKCLHCDVSLTYHKIDNSLVCHYCGYKMYLPKQCPECHGHEIKDIGYGTEKVEHEIEELFPDAKLLRMDLDTTRKKQSFDQIIRAFESHQADILIGTQMVTKGLDFSNVAVVGIINADALLKFPDFRAYERSFQLMLQVSGRAGRLHGGGKVIIQTSDPENPLFNEVIKGDYKSLYSSQIMDRETFRYPPFSRMISVVIKHKYQNYVDGFAGELAAVLRQQFGMRVLGPEYPLIARLHNNYQKQILLKFEREFSISSAKVLLDRMIEHVQSYSKNKNVSITIDVDPI